MADRGRGGYRQPRNPAPVSNPGSGRRTDGGAGSKSQPVRVPSGGAYGQRQAAEAQQSAAPMAAAGPSPTPTGAGGAGVPTGSLPPIDVFGPTGRPNEPMTAGIGDESLVSPEDPDMMLKAIIEVFPHPSLQRLLTET